LINTAGRKVNPREVEQVLLQMDGVRQAKAYGEPAGARGDVVARAGMVRAFQAPRVLTRMSVLDNMMLGAKDQPGERLGMSWFAPRRVARREREVQARAREMRELVRLSQLAGDYAGTLSGGQRKLLELGRALMTEPRMILLDEPMAGIAPVLGEQLLQHIQDLRARHMTVCVIEHDMDVVMSIADRVIVMDEGRVIAEGTPDEVQRNERVIEAYLGRLGTADPALAAHAVADAARGATP
jgi:ABC-type branched-subunit amino acid transport system ATPase component